MNTFHFVGAASTTKDGLTSSGFDVQFAMSAPEMVNTELVLRSDTTFKALTVSANATPIRFVAVDAEKPIRLRIGRASTTLGAVKVRGSMMMLCKHNTIAIANTTAHIGGNRVHIVYAGGKGV